MTTWLLVTAAVLAVSVTWALHVASLKSTIRKLECRNIELYETLRFHKAFIPVQRDRYEVKT